MTILHKATINISKRIHYHLDPKATKYLNTTQSNPFKTYKMTYLQKQYK